MAYEIDRLEIVIETATQKANKELDKLISKLNQVSTSLRSVASAAQQINKANEAISKSAQKADKAGAASQKMAQQIKTSSDSIVNASTVERMELEKKYRVLNTLLGLYGDVNKNMKMIGMPMPTSGDSLSLQIGNASGQYKQFTEQAYQTHQAEQENMARTRAAWQAFIDQMKEAFARIQLMSDTYSELNAKVADYDGAVSASMNSVIKLREAVEAYRVSMQGVTDITTVSETKQNEIAEAYKRVANAASEASAAQEILKAAETQNGAGFGMSALINKDINKEMAQFNAEYTKVRYNAAEVNQEIKKHETNFNGANSALLTLRRTLLGILSLVYVIRKGWNYINKALDFGETINLFQTVFRKIGLDAGEQFEFAFLERAEEFRDKIVDVLSLDPNEIMNYMANFTQMANSMGLVSESAYRVSESLTLLGADVASLFNIDIDTAMERLKAGLSGQIRPMRMLGVDISKTSLQMIALKYGITDSIETMDAAAKVQLRYLAMTEQLTIAMGDMARTIDSPANQLRILQQQWENFTRTLGTVFVPMITKILPILNGLVMALGALTGSLAEVAGYSDPDFTDESIYALEGLDDAADEADDTLQKLKATLGGFDELNILSATNNLEDSVGSGYAVLDEAILKSNQDYMAALNDQISQMNDKAKEWQTLFQTLLPIIISVTAAIAALKVMVVALSGSFTALGAITVLATMLYTVTQLVTQWDELDKITKFVLLTLSGLATVAAVMMAIKNATVLWTVAQAALNAVMALNPIVLIIAAIVVALAALIVYWDEVVYGISVALDWLGKLFSDIWAGIVSAFDASISWISNTWQSFVDWIIGVFKPVGDFFSGLWDGLVDGLVAAWDFIKGIFKGIGDWFGDLGKGMGDVFKDLLNKLISGLNWVIAAPFNAINGILNGIKGIDIFGLKPFDWVGTVPVPQIPMLAEGGIVDYGQLFVAREAGAELVGGFGGKTGVMNNEQIVEAVSAGVAEAVAQVMSQVDFGRGDGEKSINVFLDGRQISNAVEQNRRQRGVSIARGGNK